LKSGIHSPGRADERLPCECGAFHVARNADELLIQRCIIGECRERKPQLHIALGIGSAPIQATA